MRHAYTSYPPARVWTIQNARLRNSGASPCLGESSPPEEYEPASFGAPSFQILCSENRALPRVGSSRSAPPEGWPSRSNCCGEELLRCIYVCYVFTYVCIACTVYMYMCINIYIYICIYIYVYKCIYIYIYKCIYVYIHDMNIYIYTNIYLYKCIYMSIYIYISFLCKTTCFSTMPMGYKL